MGPGEGVGSRRQREIGWGGWGMGRERVRRIRRGKGVWEGERNGVRGGGKAKRDEVNMMGHGEVRDGGGRKGRGEGRRRE